jgi:aminopeptidase N
MKNTKQLHILLSLFLLSTWSSFSQFDNKQIDIIDILHYDFHIKIADSTDEIRAKAIINFQIIKHTDSIYLNLMNITKFNKGMHVHSVKTNTGKNLSFSHKNNTLTVCNIGDYSAGLDYVIEINYSGIPKDGLYIRKNRYGKKTFFGDNWPNRAQYWLPVIDHPSDKAKVDFYITAPKHYQIVASGQLIFKESIDDINNKYHYKTKVELATKVMVFGAADFKIKQLDSIRDIPIDSWIYKDAPDSGFKSYKNTLEVVTYYESIIGLYPYLKLASVQSKTRFGGMENAGNIFYYEDSANGEQQIESLVAHEVAHQWFGNSVSEKKWSDIWLSEGFATYLTDLYLENKYGKEKLKQRMQMEREKVVKYSKKLNVKPIVYDEKENLFKLLNRNSYEKGAWVLHMLRNKIGDDNFFRSLRLFYKEFKNINASTEDFIEVTEQVSKQNLSKFYQQWLYRNDIPALDLKWKLINDTIVIDINQNDKPYIFLLPIRLYDNKNNVLNFDLKMSKVQQSFSYKLSKGFDLQRLVIDPDVKVLYTLKK